jgi:hypothetical protein
MIEQPTPFAENTKIPVIRQIQNKLLCPTDAAVLATFRILFGVLMVWEVYRYHAYNRIYHYYIEPNFFFTYELFPFVRPVEPSLMYLIFFIMGISGLGIALGLFYRVAAILFFLTYTYIFLLDKAQYNNHYYLIILLALMFSVVDAHRWAALDQRFRPRLRAELIPFWQLFIFRAQIVIVYVYGALAKLNADWLQGEPIRTWLRDRSDYPFVGQFFTSEVVVYFFAYGGLFFDLFVGLGLIWKRTRLLSVLFVVFFHLTNGWLFSIGVFPYLMLATTVLFADADWPRRLLRFGTVKGYSENAPKQRLGYHHLALVFLGVYLLVQILVPLRHVLYPGNVSWTEEGHRFAWHMKLRDKEGYLAFFIINPISNERWSVNPGTDLTPEQMQNMVGRPDMILQYAHFLADRARADGIEDPVVRVDSMVSLNGRPFQRLVDANVNLAEVPQTVFAPAPWVVPLPPNLPIGQIIP